jgi:hypothetical protein
MSKRKQRREQGSAWTDDANQRAGQSLQDITAQGYGLNIAPTQQRIVARPISIFEIHPDPAQPRRTIPSRIREAWNGNPASVKQVLMIWWGEIQRERGEALGIEEAPFDIGAYLEGDVTERTNNETDDAKRGPLEQALFNIIMLAASIRRDGLTNPITVVHIGSGNYRVETGERRWLAYHLLHAWFDGHDGRPDERSQWEAIPARIMDEVDVWRQASENNARDNLNVIGKARQYAVLMMDLHGMDSFRGIHTFSNDREYYAQSADLSTPLGKREMLLNALGVSSPSVMTRLRHMLRLPDEIWQGGDDYNLPEDVLEKLYQIAIRDRKQALERFYEIINQTDQKADGVRAGYVVDEAHVAPGSKRHFSTLLRHVNRAGSGKTEQNQEALKALNELRIWLDEQEERISKFTS